jgi:CheY-like chemotaxis protein
LLPDKSFGIKEIAAFERLFFCLKKSSQFSDSFQAKPGTPVIIATGNAEHRGELKEKLMQTGAVDVLYKPIDLSTLMTSIAKHLPK